MAFPTLAQLYPNTVDLNYHPLFTIKAGLGKRSYMKLSAWNNFWADVETPDKFRCAICHSRISLREKKHQVCKACRPRYMSELRHHKRVPLLVRRATVA